MMLALHLRLWGSNPRSPRRTIAMIYNIYDLYYYKVPILDRPEERSQSPDPPSKVPTTVPILDRPEERSQYRLPNVPSV